MLRQIDPQTARNTILKRIPLDDYPVSTRMLEGINRIFGEPLTPAQVVEKILRDVRQRGDDALADWTEKLDGVRLSVFRVPADEIQQAAAELPLELRQALEQAIERVRAFHQAQPLHSWLTHSLGGSLGQLVRPIHRVGLYIPAGSAPLPSSIIMSAVPAQVAGVQEVVLVAPPETSSGRIAPVILATAAILGLGEIYMLGGAQAIGALAYGTQSIRRVDKIFGPGNLFVSLAKKQVFGSVGIDSIAGPTETMVIADENARPAWVVADLLAQAEHDVLAAALLLTPSQTLIDQVQVEIEKQLETSPRAAIVRESLANRSGAVLTADLQQAVALANEYAPEHLCLSVENPWVLVESIHAAGGIFIGENSCEVLGDYVAGPSHVMPTGGSARYSSPLQLLDFVHLVSLVALDDAAAQQIAPAAERLARAEGLHAHANAARLRSRTEER